MLPEGHGLLEAVLPDEGLRDLYQDIRVVQGKDGVLLPTVHRGFHLRGIPQVLPPLGGEHRGPEPERQAFFGAVQLEIQLTELDEHFPPLGFQRKGPLEAGLRGIPLLRLLKGIALEGLFDGRGLVG